MREADAFLMLKGGTIMITFLIVLAILCVIFWIGFKLTGAVFKVGWWMFIELPIAIILFCFGAVFCCTILLIPVGIWLFKTGFRLMVPGV